MRTLINVVLVLVLFGSVPASAQEPEPEHERDVKFGAAALMLLAGPILTLAAFDYSGGSCPEGYSSHKFEGVRTQCVRIYASGDSDVRTVERSVRLKRKWMLYSGLGSIAGGLILILLPGDTGQAVSNAIDLRIEPNRIRVGKTFGF